MNHQQTSFMGQISAAKKEAQELRQTMKDAARVATLTFPSPRTANVPTSDQKSKTKD